MCCLVHLSLFLGRWSSHARCNTEELLNFLKSGIYHVIRSLVNMLIIINGLSQRTIGIAICAGRNALGFMALLCRPEKYMAFLSSLMLGSCSDLNHRLSSFFSQLQSHVILMSQISRTSKHHSYCLCSAKSSTGFLFVLSPISF